jgi:hypothetical protein
LVSKSLDRAILHERQQRWRAFVGELNCYSEGSMIWNMIKRIESNSQVQFSLTPAEARPIKCEDGTSWLVTNHSKAEALAVHYAATSGVRATPASRHAVSVTREVETFVSGLCGSRESRSVHVTLMGPPPPEELGIASPFTRAELQRVIDHLTADTSPGDDLISYGLIRACPEIFFDKLLLVINSSWT